MNNHKQDYERAAGTQHTQKTKKPDNQNIVPLFAPTIIGFAYGGGLLLIVLIVMCVLR